MNTGFADLFCRRDRERFAEFYAEYDKEVPRARLEWAVTCPLSYRGTAAILADGMLLRLDAGLAHATGVELEEF